MQYLQYLVIAAALAWTAIFALGAIVELLPFWEPFAFTGLYILAYNYVVPRLGDGLLYTEVSLFGVSATPLAFIFGA